MVLNLLCVNQNIADSLVDVRCLEFVWLMLKF